MRGFDEKHYVPLLVAKAGERKALGTVPSPVADQLRPMLRVPPRDKDYVNGGFKKSVTHHLRDISDDLAKRWTRGAFVDVNAMGDGRVASGEHPLRWLVETTASSGGPEMTPVVTSASTADYMTAAATVAHIVTGDACLRLGPGDFLAGGATTRWDDLLAALGIGPHQAHLVIDLGDQVDSSTARAAAAEVQGLPYRDAWLSVTVAGTVLPDAMPSGGNTLHTIARQEWRVYEAICGSRPGRIPSYGDYGVGGPGLEAPDVDPRVLSISATLRYSTPGDWLVSKGGLYKGSGGRSLGGRAVPPAAKALLSHPAYLGDAHCAHEPWLRLAAAGSGAGNPTTWRTEGTLHHIQVATAQLAGLHGP